MRERTILNLSVTDKYKVNQSLQTTGSKKKQTNKCTAMTCDRAMPLSSVSEHSLVSIAEGETNILRDIKQQTEHFLSCIV